MTLTQAKQTLNELGLIIRKRDGEYRVTFSAVLMPERSRRELCAYYTDDLQDALDTGKALRANYDAMHGTKR